MGLRYVVLTSVDRDDLPDGGAAHFAETIRLMKERIPSLLVEVLIPDFQDDLDAIRTVVEARPDVIAHNIETTLSLTPKVRDPRANYWQSLSVLRNVKKVNPALYTKSSVMVGLGETEEEVVLGDGPPPQGGRRLPDSRAVSPSIEQAPECDRIRETLAVRALQKIWGRSWDSGTSHPAPW